MKSLTRLFIVAALFSASVTIQGSPRVNYLLHCSGCHLPDGRGSPPAVPSLINDSGRLATIPAGRDYLARVPGASQAPISDLELSEVLNYILLNFNGDVLAKDFTPITEKEVAESRQNILADPLKYREKLWHQYR